MDPRTTALILQLYAPFAALLAVVFWLGVLSQRVKVTEVRLTKLEAHTDADTGIAVQIGVLTERLGTAISNQEKLDRDMAGVQRTLANMISGKTGSITTFGQGH